MKRFLVYIILCYSAAMSSTFHENVQNVLNQGYKFPEKNNLEDSLKTILIKEGNAFTSKSTKRNYLHENFNPVVTGVGHKSSLSQNQESDSPKLNTLSMQVGKHSVKVSSVLLSKESEIKPKLMQNEIPVHPKFGHVIEIFENDYEEMKSVNENSPETRNETDNLELPPDLQVFKEVNQSSGASNSTELRKEEENSTTRHSGKEDEFAFVDAFEGSGEEAFSSDDSEEKKAGRILSIFSRQNDTSPKCVTPKGEAGHCLRFHHCILSNVLNNFNVFLQYLCLIRGALVGMCCPDNPVIEITHPDEKKEEVISPLEIKQPPEGCGLNTKTRIVGGTISVPHEWSWMVALLRRNRFYCGGVIINNWYVLTAAHCVLGIDVKDLTVRLGEYNFTKRNEHQEDISVAEIKRHSQFVTLTFQHDIALLKLRHSIAYTKFIGSICLPTQNARDYADVNGTVVGWGTVSFGGAASPILRQVTVPVWKNEDCDETYVLENISDAFLCAGSPEKGEDACQGDSGGPLMTLNSRGRWEVIGIVSWGRRCGDPTYPGVYTRVTTYLDWIAQNAV